MCRWDVDVCEGIEREESMLAVENRKSLMRDDYDAWMDVCVYV